MQDRFSTCPGGQVENLSYEQPLRGILSSFRTRSEDTVSHAPIQIEVHTPERRRRRGVTVCAGCCCCCCCLHTVGGLIGALVGAGFRKKDPVPPPSRFIHPSAEVLDEFHPEAAPAGRTTLRTVGRISRGLSSPRPNPTTAPSATPLRRFLRSKLTPTRAAQKGISVTALYWLVVLGLIPVACVGFALYDGARISSDNMLAICLGVTALGLPAIQLAAAFVTAFFTLLWPVEERSERLHKIGAIALSSVIGTVLGIGLMALCCIPMMRR